jgi:hypothetical protein
MSRLLDLFAHKGVAEVSQDRLLARDFLQRQLAAFVIQFLEPVEAVAAIVEQFAGLAPVAELLGKLQQATNPGVHSRVSRRCDATLARQTIRSEPSKQPTAGFRIIEQRGSNLGPQWE